MSIYKGNQFIAGTPDLSEYAKASEVTSSINNINNTLSGKANTNLSNVSSVSSNFKENSVGWGMPDYNSAVSVEVSFKGSSYTVQNTGYYIINLSKNTASTGVRTLINNIIIMSISITDAWEETTAIVLLKQGDVVSCSGSAYMAKITTFIPFLGVK